MLAIARGRCEKDAITFGPGDEVVIPIGYTATFHYGKNDVIIKFTELTEDFRCPPDMICIWHGRAIVEILDGNEEFLTSV